MNLKKIMFYTVTLFRRLYTAGCRLHTAGSRLETADYKIQTIGLHTSNQILKGNLWAAKGAKRRYKLKRVYKLQKVKHTLVMV